MSDTYVECLVKAKQSGAAKFFKVLLIVLTVIFGIGMFIIMPALIPAIVCGAGAYFLNLFTDLEYEYLYLDRELVVDKVMAKTKRKRVCTYSVDRMEILAPIKSYHLDNLAYGYSRQDKQQRESYCDVKIRQARKPTTRIDTTERKLQPGV